MTDPNDRTSAIYVNSYIDRLLDLIQRIFTNRETDNEYILQRPHIAAYQRTLRWLTGTLTLFDKSMIRTDGRIVLTYQVRIHSLEHCLLWNLFFRRVLFDALQDQTQLCRILHLQSRIVADNNPRRSWNYRLIRGNVNIAQNVSNTRVWQESYNQLLNLRRVDAALRHHELVDIPDVTGSGNAIDIIQDVFDELENQTEIYKYIIQFGLQIKCNVNRFQYTPQLANLIKVINLPIIPNPRQQDDDNNDNGQQDDDDPPPRRRNKTWMLVTPEERQIVLNKRRFTNRVNVNNRRKVLEKRRLKNILQNLRGTIPDNELNFLRARLK